MSKRLIMLFCALFVMAMAVPAFAAVQNVKVSGDILSRYIARDNFDLVKGNGETGEDQIGVFNTAVRVKVEADLTDNVQTVVRLINERNWTTDAGSNDTTNIDLDLAYVTMKEFLCSPLSLTIGRQELHFGNDMIIGAATTNQTTNYTDAKGLSDGLNTVNGDLSLRKSFDAIRATLNYDPLVIDLVYSKVNARAISGEMNNDDTNLYGANAAYKFNDKRNTVAEGYVWVKNTSGNGISQEPDKADVVATVGGRVSSNIVDKVNVQQEIAYQGGKKTTNDVSRDRNAWASQTMATVTPGWKHSPVIGLIYSYFSGDAGVNSDNPDKTYHAWDPMYENQTAGSIINALFGQTNCHNLDLMAKISPEFLKDVTIRGDWVYQSLSKALAENVTGGANSDYSDGYNYQANKKYLGQELDLTVTYDYTEDVQFSLMTGIFMPGKSNALAKTQENGQDIANAAQAIVGCKVSF